MRERHQTGRVVNRVQNVFEPHRDAVVGVNDLDIRAQTALRLPDVFHRRKIQRAGHDLVSLALFEIETGSHAGKRNRSVGLNLDRAGHAAQNLREAIADARGHLPPTRGPGIFAGVMFPGFVVSEHRLARRSGNRTKAVAQQVYPGSEGWKFFATAIDLGFGFHVSVSGFRLRRTEGAQCNSQGQRPGVVCNERLSSAEGAE